MKRDYHKQEYHGIKLIKKQVKGMGELWELVMGREAWRAAVHGVTKSQTRLSDLTTTHLYTQCCHLKTPLTLYPVTFLLAGKHTWSPSCLDGKWSENTPFISSFILLTPT